MNGFVNGPPRAHHYEFAHRAVPAVLMDPAVDLTRYIRKIGRLQRALTATWNAVGAGQPRDERVERTGLTVGPRAVGGVDALLITLPPAQRPAEAHFALVLPLERSASRRYLTLDVGWDAVQQRPHTVLGEWTAGGQRSLGNGPPPEAGLFVDAAAALTAS
ncbi:hypothetical protein [Nocardioides speluncae]|uniref:hypothetical protein n=1 Tax=Nocardioides speluncae TaxID=2670337 RepID=UPI000D6894EB|nr:hypothetical protein [Nocardioides speluncae]